MSEKDRKTTWPEDILHELLRTPANRRSAWELRWKKLYDEYYLAERADAAKAKQFYAERSKLIERVFGAMSPCDEYWDKHYGCVAKDSDGRFFGAFCTLKTCPLDDIVKLREEMEGNDDIPIG